jgi:hypothetical protein
MGEINYDILLMKIVFRLILVLKRYLEFQFFFKKYTYSSDAVCKIVYTKY